MTEGRALARAPSHDADERAPPHERFRIESFEASQDGGAKAPPHQPTQGFEGRILDPVLEHVEV
jgi:hypothetical protein